MTAQAISIGALAGSLDAELIVDGVAVDTPISGATHDSRQVQPGWLFACVPGASSDGHDFADAALSAGASVVLVDHPLEVAGPQLVVPDVRSAMAAAAVAIHHDPSSNLNVLGVTGTAGKTTVTQLLETVLTHCGVRTESIGTLSGARTTPESTELQGTLAAMVDRNVEAVAMEVSSHALDLHRVDGTHFAAAAFTNLGHDHLDFHGDLESYRQAKAKLFTSAFTPVSVINLDDEAGRLIADESDTEVIGYRLADAEGLATDGVTSRFHWRGHEIILRLAGTHNVLNALAVANLAEVIGQDDADIADGLCRADAPRGRFEFVNIGQPFHVVVDYAHKPEALAAVLGAARQVAGSNRVIVVFGAGGDRDRDKRPMMGAAACAGADVVVVTSDNPRGEDPQDIVAEIMAGMTIPDSQGGPASIVETVLDRRAAIGHALEQAKPGDVVLIAGKGHETYQEANGRREPFDDREVAVEVLVGMASA